MGTNHYAHVTGPGICECCLQEVKDKTDKWHMGKSSAGWFYTLRTHPDAGLNYLEDWIRWVERKGAKIYDEYGNELSLEEWVAVVLCRVGNITRPKLPPVAYAKVDPKYNLYVPKDQEVAKRGPYTCLGAEFS